MNYGCMKMINFRIGHFFNIIGFGVSGFQMTQTYQLFVSSILSIPDRLHTTLNIL
jgi:hypothetical protein